MSENKPKQQRYRQRWSYFSYIKDLVDPLKTCTIRFANLSVKQKESQHIRKVVPFKRFLVDKSFRGETNIYFHGS